MKGDTIMASKAFNTYQEIADKVRKDSPKTVHGDKIITISSLMPVKGKDSHGEQVFYINCKPSEEALQFTITANGNLKSARYIDKSAEEGSKAVFLAKDIDKMKDVVRDSALRKFAEQIDWSKVAAKEDVQAEAQAEAGVEAQAEEVERD